MNEFKEIMNEIELERQYQDKKWGGKTHDVKHGITDWGYYINEQLNDSELSHRKRFIRVAALAVAAIEAMAVVEKVPLSIGWLYCLQKTEDESWQLPNDYEFHVKNNTSKTVDLWSADPIDGRNQKVLIMSGHVRRFIKTDKGYITL